MRQWCALFLINVLLSPSVVLACSLEISEVDVENKYPKSKILRGDVNNDGIRDIVISYSEQQIKDRFDRIAVYEGQTAGSYCLVAISGNLEYGKTGFELKKGSIFVTASSNTINESVSETYQFKYRNGGYVLIGSEESEINNLDGTMYRDSKNYLTGKRIEKTTKDRKTVEKTSTLGDDESKLLSLDRFER